MLLLFSLEVRHGESKREAVLCCEFKQRLVCKARSSKLGGADSSKSETVVALFVFLFRFDVLL